MWYPQKVELKHWGYVAGVAIITAALAAVAGALLNGGIQSLGVAF